MLLFSKGMISNVLAYYSKTAQMLSSRIPKAEARCTISTTKWYGSFYSTMLTILTLGCKIGAV
jgi:hypothetical protein